MVVQYSECHFPQMTNFMFYIFQTETHTQQVFEMWDGQRELSHRILRICEKERDDGNWCNHRYTTHWFNKYILLSTTYLSGTTVSLEDINEDNRPQCCSQGHQESNRSHKKVERQLQHHHNLVTAVRGIYSRCQRTLKNGTLIWGQGGTGRKDTWKKNSKLQLKECH